MKIVTSIPPGIQPRRLGSGRIGEEYLELCVRSWMESGFEPVSINSRNERLSPVFSLGIIEQLKVDRDGEQWCDKPVVYMQDVIDLMAEMGNGPIALINADIFLKISKPILGVIRNIEPGQCIICRRHNVGEMHLARGEEYIYGIDFFVFHTSDLRRIKAPGFLFGMPWWDHHVPIAAHCAGIELKLMDEPTAFHLIHDERWDMASWLELGMHHIKTIKQSNFGEGNIMQTRRYLKGLEKIFRGKESTPRTRLRNIYRTLSYTGRREIAMERLHRVTKYNIDFFESFRAHETLL